MSIHSRETSIYQNLLLRCFRPREEDAAHSMPEKYHLKVPNIISTEEKRSNQNHSGRSSGEGAPQKHSRPCTSLSFQSSTWLSIASTITHNVFTPLSCE